MRVIKRKTLEVFWNKHVGSEQALKTWYAEASQASWKTPDDIRQKFRSADFLADNRVVFNIKGNHYRLVVKIHYASDRFVGLVYIRFIGTHSEYDRIDAETI
jgi:mRNA interferase HigB